MNTDARFASRTARFPRSFSLISALLGVVAVTVPAVARAQSATPLPQSPPGGVRQYAAPAPGQPQVPAPQYPQYPSPQYPAPGQPVSPYAVPASPTFNQYGAPVYPAPPGAMAPNGQYIAPLSQTTQPTYVPQSVALSGPRFIKDFHDGDAIPWGYHREERVRKGEIISGAIIFGVPYLYSSLIASVGSDAGSDKVTALWVPVLGPFIELGQSNSASLSYVLVLDGLAQGIGAAMVIHGLSTPRPLLVRNDLALVTVAPTTFGKDSAGFAAFGRF